MQYTSNYHLSKPDSDDIVNPNSRTGYNSNFTDIDTLLKNIESRPIARAENFLDIDRYTMRNINGTASTVSNGILNLNGTSTAGHDMCNVTNSPSTSKGFKVGDVVTFSFRVVGGTATVDLTTNVGMRTYTKDGSTQIRNGLAVITPEVIGTSWNTSTKGYSTIIVTSDMCDTDGLAYFKCYLYCRNGDVYNNCQMTFMLERGTVAHEYEPYKNNTDALSDKINILYNLIVPVGSVLCFTNDTNPNDIYDGTTWEKIEGKFLLGSSSDYVLGSTGGEAEHTLTVAELAQHSHPLYKSNPGSSSTATMVVDQSTTKTGWTSVGTGNQGSSQPHNNMPPYEVVNYWKRTA